ncbi:hypothetical protein, partial [Acidisphaera rubrifaciens]|uniref:hypothetical protein n=1 Tax=Acidisphaera rubrifaciens TaxID=50715 RepID=UPI00066241D0
AVETPAAALLGDQASRAYAADLAHSLQDRELPAVAVGPHAAANEWRLVTSASEHGGQVVPSFAVYDPTGKAQGRTDGAPVPDGAWAGGDRKMLLASAAEAAPKISDLMDRINAARMQSDPHSLYNRPARVYVPQVTGAPGDGDMSLTNQMRRQLGKLGEVVQDTATGADFTVAGQVRAVPVAGGNLRVEIAWKMSDAAGHDLGMVLQLNEVPPETVTGFWGDVALAVAQEAAGGVRDTIAKQSGHGRQPGNPAAARAAS